MTVMTKLVKCTWKDQCVASSATGLVLQPLMNCTPLEPRKTYVLQQQQLSSMACYSPSLRIKRFWTTARRYYFRLPCSKAWPAKWSMRLPCERELWGPARSRACLLPLVWGDCATRSHIPPSTIIFMLLLKLHSLSKQAGQIQTAVIKPQNCTLELLLTQPGGLHTGEKHHRPPNPTTDWHDSARSKVPFPLQQHCRNNWKSRFNK